MSQNIYEMRQQDHSINGLLDLIQYTQLTKNKNLVEIGSFAGESSKFRHFSEHDIANQVKIFSDNSWAVKNNN